MQWILQDVEDTAQLATTLDRMGEPYSLHKVVPFVGELSPEPQIPDPQQVILIGSYALWRYAEKHDLHPGVFRIAPYLHEPPWKPHLLNGIAETLTLADIPDRLAPEPPDRAWFWRPVDDSKAIAGKVQSTADILETAQKVLALDPADIPEGNLRHDVALMLCPPARIQKEWRVWIVRGEVITWSLYREGARVVYRPEIDEDAKDFVQWLATANSGYSPAYVMDICRTEAGLHLLETNCLNAAGFYAADLQRLVAALLDLA